MTVHLANLCQIEVFVTDAAASLDFFEKIFGWQEVPIEIHNYHVLDTGDKCPFGVAVVQRSAPPSSNNIVLHFAAEDPEPILQRAQMHAGERPPSRKIPGYGEVWLIKDPDGQKFGVFKGHPALVNRG